MMLRTLLLLALTALSCQSVPLSDDAAVNQLYTDVILADYDTAIASTKDLENAGRGDVISQAVNKLIDKEKQNVMDFASLLWYSNNEDIVKNRFPSQIGNIFGGVTVKIIGYRDNMVLKLGGRVDSDGDRVAYGDTKHTIGDRMAWRINPISDSRNKRQYFYIFNIKNLQFLKLGTNADGQGDHRAYGGSGHNQYRHQWYLIPVKYNGAVLFYIFNREYNQALKLSRAVDSEGDRRVYSEAGNVLGHPQSFGWIVAPL